MHLAADRSSGFLNHARRIKGHLGKTACQTPFYHWLLSSGDQPDQLDVRLADPWTGQSDIGRLMVRGVMHAHGASLPLDKNFWAISEQDPHWRYHIHSFVWLRDLRAAGGDLSRRLARQLVDEWIDAYDRYDPALWAPDVMGQRLAMWLSFYDFFCGSADERFQDKYFSSLNRQARHLSRSFPARLDGIALLQAARGLIYAGLSFPGRDGWILQGFEAVLKTLPDQMTKDGLHASLSPQNLMECTRILLDLRYALHRANLPVPKAIDAAIDRMGPALQFFVYPDRKFGLHHGGQEGDIHDIQSVLSQTRGTTKRPLKGSSLGGFERVMVGRSFLMMDHSTCPEEPYDRVWHSAPLSFEFMYGRDRIFTHCGGQPFHQDWSQILRHSAAHNMAVIDGRPVHDFYPDYSVMRRGKDATCQRQETRESCLLDASHDGYMASHGIRHRRRLFLTDQGHDLRGEETLTSTIDSDAPRSVAIRFHLHPKVQVSQVFQDQDVILTLPSGSTWRFFGIGSRLEVEESVYSGYGLKPQKTKQLVLKADLLNAELQIKWALQRE